MKRIPVIIALALVATSLIIISVFRTGETSEIWPGFRVLVTGDSVPEDRILDALTRAGLDKVAAQTTTRFPQPEDMPLFYPSERTFLSGLASWFHDPVQGLRFLYLKDSVQLEARTQKAFEQIDVNWILEDSSSFSTLPAVLSAILCLVQLIVLRKRLLVFVTSIPFIIVSLASPTVPVLASSLLLIHCTAHAVQIWDCGNFDVPVRQRLQNMVCRPSLILLAGSGIFISAFSGILSLISSFTAFVMAVSTAFLYETAAEHLRIIQSQKRIRPDFRPVPIGSLWKKRRITQQKQLFLALIPPLLGPFFLVAPFLQGASSGTSSLNGLSIPSPSGYTADPGFSAASFRFHRDTREPRGVTDLSDYVYLSWDRQGFPYRAVLTDAEDPAPGSSISYTDYRSTDTGGLEPVEITVEIFNDDFVTRVLDDPRLPLLFTMMKKQGRFMSAGLQPAIPGTAQAPDALCLLAVLLPLGSALIRMKK